MLFRGYLPIMSGWSMAQFLKAHEIGSGDLKAFLLANAERVKAHAQAMAEKQGRPFQYLSTSLRKEDAARKLAERDGVEDGLVCVFSVLEPCRTFSFRFAPAQACCCRATRLACLATGRAASGTMTAAANASRRCCRCACWRKHARS